MFSQRERIQSRTEGRHSMRRPVDVKWGFVDICSPFDVGEHRSTGSGQATLHLVMEHPAGEMALAAASAALVRA